jgi:3-methyladenine DNA glycosylase AlkD
MVKPLYLSKELYGKLLKIADELGIQPHPETRYKREENRVSKAVNWLVKNYGRQEK